MKRKKEYTGRCYWENSKNGVCLLAKKTNPAMSFRPPRRIDPESMK